MLDWEKIVGGDIEKLGKLGGVISLLSWEAFGDDVVLGSREKREVLLYWETCNKLKRVRARDLITNTPGYY